MTYAEWAERELVTRNRNMIACTTYGGMTLAGINYWCIHYEQVLAEREPDNYTRNVQAQLGLARAEIARRKRSYEGETE